MSEFGSFTIQIKDEDGDPIEGEEVTIFHHGIAGGLQKEHTDEDGEVEFEMHHHTLNITQVYVGDELVDTDISPDDGDTLSYTV